MHYMIHIRDSEIEWNTMAKKCKADKKDIVLRYSRKVLR